MLATLGLDVHDFAQMIVKLCAGINNIDATDILAAAFVLILGLFEDQALALS